jgi:hypothetical protein
MRLFAALLLSGALAGSFFVGRLSRPAQAAAASASGGSVFIAAQGDVIRIPRIRTRCVVSGEAGRPDMLCDHTPRGRYELVLFRDALLVYRNGNPDEPRFSVRWNP